MSAGFRSGTAYFGVRNPAVAIHDLRCIADARHTHVLLTWSEEDQWYYKDTMGELVELATSLGLSVYTNPWGVGRVFGGEAFSELAARNPGWAQCAPDGSPLVASCPNHPGFREWMFGWIDTVCATKIETVFWDEPHFHFDKKIPGLWACRCNTCRSLFAGRFGYDMPAELTPEVRNFREDSLVDFLVAMTNRVRQAGKRNSVCVLPPWFEDGLGDWSRIASMPSIDEIGTDPYWEKGQEDPHAVREAYLTSAAKIKSLADQYQIDSQMWVKNYHIPIGKEEVVQVATEACFQVGIRNIFAWSYRGSAFLSWLRSGDPEKVWRLQVEAFASCRRRSV